MNWQQRVNLTASSIAEVQYGSGAIPWFAEDKVDPWNHVEAAMGLDIGGKHDEAAAAYHWLAQQQNPNGSWYAEYRLNEAGILTHTTNRIESNFVAYIACGVWHHYLITGDFEFLSQFAPVVSRAMDYVLGLQAPSGEIYWAEDYGEGINQDALVTGCASIYHSLGCAQAIGRELDQPEPLITAAADRLQLALFMRPERFDRTWESKARFSMDWFYPVMCGVYDQQQGRKRLDARWKEFVHPSLGCRCVSDQPWVTVAETCELALACVVCGWPDRANKLLDGLTRHQLEDGSWWTGYQFAESVYWPKERPTWTAGAICLAADAIHQLTPAHQLFSARAAQNT